MQKTWLIIIYICRNFEVNFSMVLDIDSLRPERGGDPEKVRQNQRDRYCDPNLVDIALQFDDKWKKG